MRKQIIITTKQDPEALARLNDIMRQAGQMANEAGARYAFEDHTARKADNTINNLLQFREAVALGLDNPTEEDRRRWLEILQTTVTVTGGIAVITCRLGGKVRKNLSEIPLHES